MEKKNVWETYSAEQLTELEKICADYRVFLDNGKTERECVDTIVNTVEAAGYVFFLKKSRFFPHFLKSR